MAGVRWWSDIDMRQLAERLGIQRAGQKSKWACPRCGSRDNLHLYAPPREGHCFGCGPVDAPNLVMQMQSCNFKDALKFLDPERKIRDDFKPAPEKVYEPVEKKYVDAYTWIWEHADPLSSAHKDWFAARGINTEMPIHGFSTLGEELRTVRTEYWRAVVDRASLDLGGKSDKGYLPWWDQSWIMLPYFCDGGVDGIRFRRTHESSGPKIMSLAKSKPTARPFGSYLLTMDESKPLFIVEGEVDALALTQIGYDALAVPGATIWYDHWTDYVRSIIAIKGDFGQCRERPVIVIGDGQDKDDAGGKMARRIGLKTGWRYTTWSSGDANDLLIAGTLHTEMERILHA